MSTEVTPGTEADDGDVDISALRPQQQAGAGRWGALGQPVEASANFGQSARRLLVRSHIHPEPSAAADGGRLVDPLIARVLHGDDGRPYDAVKRAIDVAISLVMLVMVSPMLLRPVLLLIVPSAPVSV